MSELKELKNFLDIANDPKKLKKINTDKTILHEVNDLKMLSKTDANHLTDLQVLKNLIYIIDKNENTSLNNLSELKNIISNLYSVRSTYKTNLSKLKKLLTNKQIIKNFTEVFKSTKSEVKIDRDKDEKRVKDLNEFSSEVDVENVLKQLHEINKPDNISRIDATILLCYCIGMRYNETMLFDLKHIDEKKDKKRIDIEPKVKEWIKQYGVLKDRRKISIDDKDNKDIKNTEKSKRIIFKPILKDFTAHDAIRWQKIVRGKDVKNPSNNENTNKRAEELFGKYITGIARNDDKDNKQDIIIKKAKWLHFGRAFYANLTFHYYAERKSLISWIPEVLGHESANSLQHYTRVKLIFPNKKDVIKQEAKNTADINKIKQEVKKIDQSQNEIKNKLLKWMEEKKIPRNKVTSDDMIAILGKRERSREKAYKDTWLDDAWNYAKELDAAEIPVTNILMRKFGFGAENAAKFMKLYKAKKSNKKIKSIKVIYNEEKKEDKKEDKAERKNQSN